VGAELVFAVEEAALEDPAAGACGHAAGLASKAARSNAGLSRFNATGMMTSLVL
jgi:hypothetical protein